MDANMNELEKFYPILKTHEILSLLEEVGVTLTQEELTDPVRHKEKLRKMWLEVVRAALPGAICLREIRAPCVFSFSSC